MPPIQYAETMTGSSPKTTPTIDQIIDNFSLLDEWDDRYRYVIELGRDLCPLPEQDRSDANKVQGCASQVWLATNVRGDDHGPVLDFTGDSDAHIVRGLIAILFALFSGKPSRRFSPRTRTRCSSAWVCVSISRRSGRMASAPWSNASARMHRRRFAVGETTEFASTRTSGRRRDCAHDSGYSAAKR